METGGLDVDLLLTKGTTRPWIIVKVWNQLVDNVWSKTEWQSCSRQTKQSYLIEKDSNVAKHIGGSLPFALHQKRMESYTLAFLHKYGEEPSTKLKFYLEAWIEAIGKPISTHTHIYEFGITVPVLIFLDLIATFEFASDPESAQPLPSFALKPKRYRQWINNVST
ncbi:Uncharacterized protein TCM_010604 [Theobroma cacao]|uniref:Uncharacterized protein n=1 Tax=Theobroma cacao TaxID=3641 RepID=A0A061EEL7_THECC|nr:Uncharacterized protein TCM_010604 [Theobroma cacao]